MPLRIITTWQLCSMTVIILNHLCHVLGDREILITCRIAMSGRALMLPVDVQARGLTSYGLSESANVMSDTEYEQFKSTWQPQPLRPQQSLAAVPAFAAAGSQVNPVARHRSASSARSLHSHRAHALPVRRPTHSLFQPTFIGMSAFRRSSPLPAVVSRDNLGHGQQLCRF